MKKHSIKLIFLSALFYAITPACTDLDETVYDQIPADQFGVSETQINAIIGPIYRSLRSYWPGDIFLLTEQAGGMAITPTRVGGDWYNGGAEMEICRHTWQPRNQLIQGGWNAANNGIATCNKIYATIEQSEALTPEAKAKALAEIRAVRAFWHYILCDIFGNAPLMTKFDQSELPEVSSRKEIYEFCVKELTEIVDLLPSERNGSTYSKFTKGAAYTLLAKLYLNAEIYTGALTAGAFTPGKSEWEKCVEVCDKVMGLDYLLEPNWTTNFEVKNEASREIILAIPYSSTEGGNHIIHRSLHYMDPIALGLSIGPWNGTSACPDYVKSFDPEDPRKEKSFLLGEMRDPATGEIMTTAHGRPLIHTEEINMLNTDKYDGVWGEVNQEEGARVNKWVMEPGMSSEAENDFAIFRLADVILMKAEALVRLGRNGEALPLVNQIRERAYSGTNLKPLAQVTLEDIYNERRWELAWEAHARQDQIRFGKYLEPRWGKPETEPVYKMLMPIPIEAWEKNNKLIQNPGYPAF